ncbi:MAG: hypothetical protein RDV48_27995 [Candidatus Eremiobacteraeota bacterium]|nr:hypothetical protein [Candidatus Eremiobacteraeota bacterium]
MMALEAYKKSKADWRLRYLMDLRDKADHDYATDIAEAKREGIEEGKIEAARKLLAEGMKREDIARILNLSCEDF